MLVALGVDEVAQDAHEDDRSSDAVLQELSQEGEQVLGIRNLVGKLQNSADIDERQHLESQNHGQGYFLGNVLWALVVAE